MRSLSSSRSYDPSLESSSYSPYKSRQSESVSPDALSDKSLQSPGRPRYSTQSSIDEDDFEVPVILKSSTSYRSTRETSREPDVAVRSRYYKSSESPKSPESMESAYSRYSFKDQKPLDLSNESEDIGSSHYSYRTSRGTSVPPPESPSRPRYLFQSSRDGAKDHESTTTARFSYRATGEGSKEPERSRLRYPSQQRNLFNDVDVEPTLSNSSYRSKRAGSTDPEGSFSYQSSSRFSRQTSTDSDTDTPLVKKTTYQGFRRATSREPEATTSRYTSKYSAVGDLGSPEPITSRPSLVRRQSSEPESPLSPYTSRSKFSLDPESSSYNSMRSTRHSYSRTAGDDSAGDSGDLGGTYRSRSSFGTENHDGAASPNIRSHSRGYGALSERPSLYKRKPRTQSLHFILSYGCPS